MQGEASPVLVGALVAALRSKGELVDELAGMVESMRAHATQVTLPVEAVDTCGTGGDAARTFNISTAAALVAAGAGCPVAKHGNRAASSRCGSADVLEALGVVIALSPEGVRRCVEEAGIGFLFAPRSILRCVTSPRFAASSAYVPCSTCSARWRTRSGAPSTARGFECAAHAHDG